MIWTLAWFVVGLLVGGATVALLILYREGDAR